MRLIFVALKGLGNKILLSPCKVYTVCSLLLTSNYISDGLSKSIDQISEDIIAQRNNRDNT